jgi:hypothetical protein
VITSQELSDMLALKINEKEVSAEAARAALLRTKEEIDAEEQKLKVG